MKSTTEHHLPFSVIKHVFVALLIDILAFTIILPLLPRLLDEYRQRGNDGFLDNILSLVSNMRVLMTQNLDPKIDIVLIGGFLGSLYSFLQFLVSPWIGSVSDRLGRKKTLLLTMCGNILSTVVWLYAGSFQLFLLSRIIAGLSEGNVQISVAMISDVTSHQNRSKGMAFVGIAFAIGFTLGPGFSAYFSNLDLPFFDLSSPSNMTPFFLSALFALILLIVESFYILIFIPETKNKKLDKLSQTILSSQQQSDLFFLSTIHFFYLLIFSGMEFTLTFLTYDLFNFTNLQQGRLLGFIGIMSTIFQASYVRRLAHRLGEKNIVSQGLFTCALALFVISTMLSTSNSKFWLYISATCLAFTSATVVNCLTSIASMIYPSQHLHSGSLLGKFRSLGQLGRALGPMVSCFCYWRFGYRLCYLFGASTMFLILILFSSRSIKVSKTRND